MFDKVFIDTLINFLYTNLKNTPVTKTRIKQLFVIFDSCWREELKETKYAKKNEKKAH